MSNCSYPTISENMNHNKSVLKLQQCQTSSILVLYFIIPRYTDSTFPQNPLLLWLPQTDMDSDNVVGIQRGVARSTSMFTNTSGTLCDCVRYCQEVENHLLSSKRPQSNREPLRHQIQFSTVCDEYRVRVRSALRIHRRKNTEKAGSAWSMNWLEFTAANDR